MMKSIVRSGLVAGMLIACTAHGSGVQKDGQGVNLFLNWGGLSDVSRADCPHMRGVQLIKRWKNIEPSQDVYEFESEIGQYIEMADSDDLYVKILIYVGADAPQWIFDAVPNVHTDRDGGLNLYPYYFDPFYKAQFFEMIDEFGAYLQGLDQDLQDRVIFVFAVEGATADGAPYKGNVLPADSQYDITTEEWAVFRSETWARYRDAMPDVPIVVNSDWNTNEQNQWLIDNMNVVGLKYGMFSHGYHISDGIERLAEFRDIEARTLAAGKELITEGEQDAEIFRHAWGTNNPLQAIYWGGIYATHNPIYSWNVPETFLLDSNAWTTLEFFNRYAVVQQAWESPRAFVALRDGLNSADTTRFPVGVYGTADKSNTSRYVNIANAFSGHGARMEDPLAATGGGMINRQREGYNDAGWNILPGNYSRFIEQINPGSGDVGWWHVDVIKTGCSYAEASKYSRFARGFENASGKNAMYFDVADRLADELLVVPGEAVITVIYYDEVAGSTWELQYDNGSGMSAVAVTNSGSGDWKTLEVAVNDAVFLNGGPNGADLALVNTDSLDDIFHMIDVEFQVAPVFKRDPVIKNSGFAGTPYVDTLAGDAVDLNGDSVQYSLVPGGPSWLTVSPDGTLSGTPGGGDVGLNSWTVQVDDGNGMADTAELLIVIDAAPTTGWFELLYDDFESGWGNWLDGGDRVDLTSEKALGTQCVHVRHNLGDDSSLFLANPVDLSGYSRVEVSFSFDSVNTSAGDGFRLQLSTDGGTSWTTVKYYADGIDYSNNVREYPVETLNDSTYGFTAHCLFRFESQTSGPARDIFIDNIRISVLVSGNQRPVFIADPLVMPNAGTNTVYNESLASRASDPENDDLTFSRISGPAWLHIGADGTLVGMPLAGDLGNNLFCVKVEDSSSNSDYALMTVQVVGNADSGNGTPPHNPVLFAATFTGSQPNTNEFSNSSPVPDPYGGLVNLNAGTSNGSWSAVSLEESSIYLNDSSNPVLFAGTGAYELTAHLEQTALISDQIDISLDFALCRLGNTDTRRNFVTGLDESGNRVFRIWLSGNGLDDGGRTLYIETPEATHLLAANIARSAGDGFTDGTLDRLDVQIDDTGVAVSLNGSEKTNGVPVYSVGATSLSKIVFEGESTWYDNITVVSTGTPTTGSPYTEWENAYALVNGPTGDDDNDGILNLAEFGLGGNPTNSVDRGCKPVLQVNNGSPQVIHAWRAGVTYSLETCDNLISNSWTNAVYTLIGYEPYLEDLGFVTNRLDEPASDTKFIRLRMGL